MQAVINRRNILGAAIAGSAAITSATLPVSAGAIPSTDIRLITLEQIIADVKAAALLPDDQADEAMDKAEIALEHMMADVYANLSSPPTQTDLALCGRIAEYWAYRTQCGCDSSEERATNQLILVTLAAAGLQPSENMTRTAETVADLITFLGGAHIIADFCGISSKAVLHWEENNLIPVGWRSRLADFASRRHVRISPRLMEA